MTNKILEKIIQKSGVQDLPEILSKHLNSSELQSLMIEVYRRRSEDIPVTKVLNDYLTNRFVSPSVIPQEQFLQFDSLAVNLLPEGFETIELSPVSPLGTCAVIGNISQNRVVSTSRNNEVVADSTNTITLECVKLRKLELKSDPRSVKRIKLASSHRLIRGQTFDPDKKFTAHFRVFSLCTAGRDEGHLKFEIESLIEHIEFYLMIFKHTLSTESYLTIEVFLTDFSNKNTDQLHAQVLSPLSKKYNHIQFSFDQHRKEARSYYDDICFKITLTDLNNVSWDLVDGGFTDWTRKYLSNDKERLLTTGIGSELFLKAFKVKI